MSEENGTIEFNKDELTPPDFINEEFFENVLRTAECDKALKITKLEIVPGTKPGDHFASIMFKALVSYISRGIEVSSRSLIVKTMPVESGIKKEMLDAMPFFPTEIDMYTKVLPQMKTIMQSVVEDYEELAPKLLYHSTDPPTLVFEDISVFGYEMHNGFFDFDNTVKVLVKLAKFHALSYYMNDNKYSHSLDLTKYKTAMNDDMMERFKTFFGGFPIFKDIVAKWAGFEKIAEKIGEQEHKFMKNLMKGYEPNPEPGFNVLCHGDFHIKNMMFLKNGADIEKTMFLDFQICFWGSPAVDLYYVLYSIGDAETRKRRGEILHIYHNALTDYLERLGCMKKPPTLLDLNIQMLERGILEIMWSMCLLPFFCLDFTKVTMDDMIEPTAESMAHMRRMMYENPFVLDTVREALPDLFYKGILA